MKRNKDDDSDVYVPPPQLEIKQSHPGQKPKIAKLKSASTILQGKFSR
jgi:hypothetical protein